MRTCVASLKAPSCKPRRVSTDLRTNLLTCPNQLTYCDTENLIYSFVRQNSNQQSIKTNYEL